MFYLQTIYGVRDAPVVTLQGRLTLLQRDTVHRPLDLSITTCTQRGSLNH